MFRCSFTNSGCRSLIANVALVLLLSQSQFCIAEDFKPQPGVPSSPDAVSTSNVGDQFLSWLQQMGFTDVFKSDRKISIHFSPDGDNGERGLVAVRPIRAGERMGRIPLSSALSFNPVEDPEPFPDAGWALGLVAKLLREIAKGPTSRWRPFLALFPRNQPIPWLQLGAKQLAELQYAPTQRRIAAFQVEVQNAWVLSDQALVGNASWGDFAWAVNAVWTAAVSLRVPTGQGSDWRHMFLPVADLLNHSQEPNTFWLDRVITAEHVELVASADIRPGAPLLAHYGDLTTEAMFLMYGFVPGDNPGDTTVVFSSLGEAVEWYWGRYLSPQRWGARPNITTEELHELMEVGTKGVVREMKAAGRRVDPKQLKPVDHVDPHDNGHGGAMVVYRDAAVDMRLLGAFAQLERVRTKAFWEAGEDEWRVDVDAAFDVVSRRAAEMLAEFPTTVADDERMLRDCSEGGEKCGWDKEEVTAAMLLTVQFRVVKKMMLHKLVDTHPPFSIHLPHSHLVDHTEL